MEGEDLPFDVHHEEIDCLCGGLETDSFWLDQRDGRTQTESIDQKIQQQAIMVHPGGPGLAS